MRELKLSDVEWSLLAEPEYHGPTGHFATGDDAIDDEICYRIITALDRGNQWAWCQVTLCGRYKGLSAQDYLGGCSYASEEDFKQTSGYYDDMQQNILTDLQSQLTDLCSEESLP